MEEDQDLNLKHTCKFCSKNFPCGRSLGGHMRSHLITISSSSNHQKKKLPTAINGEDRFGYGLRANPRKTNKALKSRVEGDALLEGNFCKECGKRFQSLKALFGHMKCHPVNGRIVEEDSWDDSDHDGGKLIDDGQSDNEGGARLCRRKRSGRIRRYTSNGTNSSSLSMTNLSCETEQQEQEEVALSLIILSRDKGDWSGLNYVVESSDNSSQFVEFGKVSEKNPGSGPGSEGIFKTDQVKQTGLKTPSHPKLEFSAEDEFQFEGNVNHTNQVEHDIGCNESEVDSPRNPNREKGFDQVEKGRIRKSNKTTKRKCIDVPVQKPALAYGDSGSEFVQDSDKKSKFACSICKKGFPSYQALGGHRASHKKFKGSCAPRSQISLETEHSPNQSSNTKLTTEIPTGHECPVCFKVFQSGQALGGHKRSHLTGDQNKSSNPSIQMQQPIRQDIRHFLDLNLPAPDEEEESNDFKPWWTIPGHEPLLGLLSSL